VVAFLVGSRLVHDTFRLNRKRAANNVKVLINFMQINSFLQYFRVEWTDAMRSVFQAQDSAGASGLSIVGWDCLVQSSDSFFVEFAAYMAIPAIFLFLSPLTVAGARLFTLVNPKYHFREDWGFYIDALVTTFTTLLYLMFPALVYRTFAMLDCVTIASMDDSVLRNNVLVTCNSAAYAPYRVAAMLFLGAYCLGIPALMTAAMTAARGSLMMRSSNVDAAVILTSTDVEIVSRHLRDSFEVAQGRGAGIPEEPSGHTSSRSSSRSAGRRDDIQAVVWLSNPRDRRRANMFSARQLFDAAYARILDGRAPVSPREVRQFTRRSELLQVRG
jgi:hypothetical protein